MELGIGDGRSPGADLAEQRHIGYGWNDGHLQLSDEDHGWRDHPWNLQYGLFNQQPQGPLYAGSGLLSIGSNNTSLQAPFGVDATDITYTTSVTCPAGGGTDAVGAPGCTSGSSSTVEAAPLLTEYNAGQVSYLGSNIPVGSYPVAIKAYGSATVITFRGSGSGGTLTRSYTGPARAVVVNSGSNNITILDLVSDTTAATIAVGVQPSAVVLNPAATLAYVANYGSGTVSVVNLSTLAVSKTTSVGASPMALTVDPSGNYIWVGGLNYISEVSLSSFSPVSTYTVNGQVTSLAIAATPDALLYTLVTNGTNFQVAQSKLSTGAFVNSYAQMSAANYSCSGCDIVVSPTSLLASGVVVSANYSNNAVVTGTPTGFAVIDLSTNQQVLTGSASGPVRGIATDASQGMVYMTVPGSNTVMSVPLPPIAAN